MHWACKSHLLVSYALAEGSAYGAQKTMRGPGNQGRQVQQAACCVEEGRGDKVCGLQTGERIGCPIEG